MISREQVALRMTKSLPKKLDLSDYIVYLMNWLNDQSVYEVLENLFGDDYKPYETYSTSMSEEEAEIERDNTLKKYIK